MGQQGTQKIARIRVGPGFENHVTIGRWIGLSPRLGGTDPSCNDPSLTQRGQVVVKVRTATAANQRRHGLAPELRPGFGKTRRKITPGPRVRILEPLTGAQDVAQARAELGCIALMVDHIMRTGTQGADPGGMVLARDRNDDRRQLCLRPAAQKLA